MAKETITLNDFPVAARRQRAIGTEEGQDTSTAPDDSAGTEASAQAETTAMEEPKPRKKSSLSLSLQPEERREQAIDNANKREDSRNRLRDLRRSRERESKHFVNVPLDYNTKRRLEKAAHENDLKMTIIMRAAIDQYLTDNGY